MAATHTFCRRIESGGVQSCSQRDALGVQSCSQHEALKVQSFSRHVALVVKVRKRQIIVMAAIHMVFWKVEPLTEGGHSSWNRRVQVLFGGLGMQDAVHVIISAIGAGCDESSKMDVSQSQSAESSKMDVVHIKKSSQEECSRFVNTKRSECSRFVNTEHSKKVSQSQVSRSEVIVKAASLRQFSECRAIDMKEATVAGAALSSAEFNEQTLIAVQQSKRSRKSKLLAEEGPKRRRKS